MLNSFSIIIPTYKRQKELADCLGSILRQDLLPAEIIIVDDEELSEEFLKLWKNESAASKINFIYYRKNQTKEIRGSSSSRNIGLSLAKEKICFIFDDDIRLENYFFSKTMAAWIDDPKLLGIGGVIINNRQKSTWEKGYNVFFGLNAKLPWDINRLGFQSWDDGINGAQKAFYVHGGVCVYDKEAVQKLGGFTVFGGGREALEDVDFCWRAKLAGFYFLLEPMARAFHAHSSSGREDEFTAGYKESANRKKIWHKLGRKGLGDLFCFCWANVGWILRQILKGNFKKTGGMIKGLL